MAAPNPATWTAGTPAVADFNTEIRDAMRWLLGQSGNPKHHAKLWSSTNYTHTTSGAFEIITFDTVRVDRGAMYDAGSPNLLTIPEAGTYLIGGTANFESGTYNADLRVIDSNGRILVYDAIFGINTPTEARLGYSTFAHFAGGETITLEAKQDSGGPIDILSIDEFSPSLWAGWYGTDT